MTRDLFPSDFDAHCSKTRLFGSQGDIPARHDFLTAAITHTNDCKYFAQCGYRAGELSAYTDHEPRSCQVFRSKQAMAACFFLDTKAFKTTILRSYFPLIGM